MKMNDCSNTVAVQVKLYLENPQLADKIERAIAFFFNSNREFEFSEIEYEGVNEARIYDLTFYGHNDAAQIADDVHRFLSVFIDEFYDEELEDDWLNEIDSDELPVIQKYEVLPAKEVSKA